MVMDEAPEVVEKVFQNHPSAIWFGFGSKMVRSYPIRITFWKARARRCGMSSSGASAIWNARLCDAIFVQPLMLRTNRT